MIAIKNIEGLSGQDIAREIKKGAKFVTFRYCFSIIIMTFKRGTDIYFIKSDESSFKHHFGFTLLTLLFGWWGIPWGPIYTIGSLYTNLSGGKDVTAEVLKFIIAQSEAE